MHHKFNFFFLIEEVSDVCVTSGLRATGTQKSMVFGIVVARYIALPLAGIVIVKGSMRLNLVQADPLYEFVLLIQYAVPPAMNMGKVHNFISYKC